MQCRSAHHHDAAGSDQAGLADESASLVVRLAGVPDDVITWPATTLRGTLCGRQALQVLAAGMQCRTRLA